MNLSVIIVTMNRVDCMRRCLDCLYQQNPRPQQIIVVDASTNDQTRELMKEYPHAEYIRSLAGYGHMSHSRNLGLASATGDIVSFIDDDAFVFPDWLPKLLEPYADLSVGGVGGRALRRQPGEEKQGVDCIGKILPDGSISGNFAADPRKIIEVEHIIGCNMSWRRKVLGELGGLREIYAGTEVCEETDIAIRVRKMGYKLMFTPFAVVDHIGAPQVKGRRFDTRYKFYVARNQTVLYLTNFGPASRLLWRFILRSAWRTIYKAVGKIVITMIQTAVHFCGLAAGFFFGLAYWVRTGSNPKKRP